ncbi:MAG: hypothetical protein LBG93_09585 [Treponema sp.]|jgi:hypothetical protein|nr:hypothetical protein [Treponema sp.]
MRKRLGTIAALMVIFTFPVSASVVTFTLVETGIDYAASSGHHSQLWESGLMSVFFDAGYIVTSKPIARVKAVAELNLDNFITASINEALGGGASYVVFGFIQYNNVHGRALPVGIELHIYDSVLRQRIHRQSFPAGTGRNNSEELQLAHDAGRMVISHMLNR